MPSSHGVLVEMLEKRSLSPGHSPVQPAPGDPASAGVGLDDPQRSLPTPAMLGSWDSVRGALPTSS